MLYVLPYGQMSLWAATVITNLLSAIPWIGQDFVEFEKLLLFIITLSIFYYYFTTEHYYNMTTIGKVNESALRGQKSRTGQDKQAFLFSISYDFMSMFIGLIDGDGYIAITKIGLNTIRMELVLSVDIKDLKLLQHIKDVLKIGRINEYPNISTAKLMPPSGAVKLTYKKYFSHLFFIINYSFLLIHDGNSLIFVCIY